MLQHSRKTYNNDQQECTVTLQNILIWLGAPAIANQHAVAEAAAEGHAVAGEEAAGSGE